MEIGREDKKSNDLFYLCSLVEYIGRKTFNKRSVVVNKIGKEKLSKIYNLADVYHSDNIENVATDLIKQYNIENGVFDNVKECKYNIPTFWDIGKVYKRLILSVAQSKQIDVVSALIEVYNSSFCRKLDDYNSSVFYDNPENIFLYYTEGTLEK